MNVLGGESVTGTTSTTSGGVASALTRRCRTRLVPTREESVLLVAVGVALAAGAWNAEAVLIFVSPPRQGLVAQWAWAASLTVTVVWVLGFVWRLGLCLWYRPAPAIDDDRLPVLSVVLPVFNEAEQIEQTLTSVAAAGYAAGSCEVIVVDDGSSDATGSLVERFLSKSSLPITLLRQGCNHGKRLALVEGFRRAKGDVIVTIDSDCLLDHEAFKAIVAPMVENPKVGAVAGNIRVLNHDASILTRMLVVSFAVAFDFSRSAQSVLGGVLCTPGAFSAFRREALLGVLDQWEHQRFLGRESRIGEDRGLTTLVLRSGWTTVYQANATCRTIVPSKTKGMLRMLLRWTRGDIRESLHYLRMVAFRRPARLAADANFVLTLIEMITPYPVLLWVVYQVILSPQTFVAAVALAILGSVPPLIWYAARHRSWNVVYGFAYAFFWIITCSWVFPWSIATVRDDRWMTRATDAGVAG
jgi:hyaluronan synthase